MRRLVILIVLVFFGSLLGCGQASREVGQVKLGMTRAEAVAILGEPQERETGTQGELLRWTLAIPLTPSPTPSTEIFFIP